MTREEREKAIDALKFSAPVMAVTQKEFDDYIQTLNKIMDWLEQEPCDDAISRAEVLSHAKTDRGNGHEQPFDYVEVDVIKQLPPVTPSYNSIKTELEPCNDAISRQMLKAKMFDLPKPPSNKTYWDGVDDVGDLIDKLPPVTPQYTDAEIQKMQDLEFAEIQKAYEIGKAETPNKWIPVNEKLPEEYGEYICTMSNGYVQECGFVPNGEKGLIAGWSTCEADGFKKLDYQDVIAWMPLPEKYTEEGTQHD